MDDERDVIGEALCLDNAGLEEDFEIGIVYQLLDSIDDEILIWVENMCGEPKQVLPERFKLTIDQKMAKEIRKRKSNKRNADKAREFIEEDRKHAEEFESLERVLKAETEKKAKEEEEIIKKMIDNLETWIPEKSGTYVKKIEIKDVVDKVINDFDKRDQP